MLKSALCLALLAIGYYYLRDWSKGCKYRGNTKIDGQIVLVSGANTGLGYETVKYLATKNAAEIIMVCRNAKRCENAKNSITKDLGTNIGTTKLSITLADFNSLQSVSDMADSIAKSRSRLDILINNAGIMWVPLEYSQEGHESHFGVNHLSHFLLTKKLLPLMLKTVKLHEKPGKVRVIHVSSLAHERAGEFNLTDPGSTKDYGKDHAYCQSKLANVLFGKELAKQYGSDGLISVSLHPGVVTTELGRHILPDFVQQHREVLGTVLPMKTQWEGAQTQIHCALAPSVANHNGEYFSDCVPKEPTVYAKDEVKAKQLWELSEKLTNKYFSQ